MRRALGAAMGLLMKAMLMSATISGASANDLQGLENPTLSMNLSAVRDWEPGLQFLDIMKVARPWKGDDENGKRLMEAEEIGAEGHLDAEGWPTSIPDGVESIATVWRWGSFPEGEDSHVGVYVVDYEGAGDLRIEGDVTLLPSEEGQLRFHADGGNVTLRIYETDPEGTGDHLRDITVVKEEHVPLHEAGAVFNPDWVALIEDSRELRFMDWMETNDSEVVSWADRPLPDGGPRHDVSLEDMVQLANETGADPWFTIPHLADEDYIRAFATYVRDNLDPSLTAKVEYSNETWNWQFDQADWLLERSETEWGENARADYHVKKAVETALVWDEVFGVEADGRVSHVLATQAGNPGLTGRMLEAKKWREHEPDAYVDPARVFDEVAVTTYFGGKTLRDEAMRDALLQAIKDPEVDATAYYHDRLLDPDYDQSLPDVAAILAQQADLAHAEGLKLVAYEGGQHVHHSGRMRDLSEADAALLQDFMTAFVRSPEMADLYRQSWADWAEIGDGAYMQFGDMTKPRGTGSWGIYESLDTVTERGLALQELNAAETPWWDDVPEGAALAEGAGAAGSAPATHRQQGVIEVGTDGADALSGTAQEDYLLAGAGDDVLEAGAGNDGIHGGAGVDRAVFSGRPGQYAIRIEGDGHRIEGPDGSDFLIDVEELAFEDGTVLALDALEGLSAERATILPDPQADPVPAPEEVEEAAAPAPVEIADPEAAGVRVQSINVHSEVGDALGLPGSGRAAFATTARGATVEIGGRTVEANYWSLNTGRAERDGEILVDDPLSLTRAFGEIVEDPGALVTGAGDDRFSGRDEDSEVHTGAGRDRLVGRAGQDRLDGGQGRDTLLGGEGADVLTGGGGADTFVLQAGDGIDRITDFDEGDTIRLREFLSEGQGIEDAVFYVDGAAVISNGRDSIVLEGVSEAQVVRIRGDGIDGTVEVGGAPARSLADRAPAAGTAMADRLDGGASADHLRGRAGDDLLRGGGGRDDLKGGSGDDVLRGGGGDDRLKGGAGDDVLRGGQGRDTFVFAAGQGDDVVRDFSEEDRLDLRKFLSEGQSLEGAVSHRDGDTVVTNGADTITFEGIDAEDMDWFLPEAPSA